jgi:nuclear receptor-binding protein
LIYGKITADCAGSDVFCQVQQRDVPGIDCAFLAMDNEEGVEVVWNEVRISEKKSSKVQLVNIKSIAC